MAKNTKSQFNVIRICKIHFVLVALIIAQTILYDASMLIASDVVLKRWLISATLLAATTAVWYFAKSRVISVKQDQLLIFTLIITDILVASYGVYAGRGMASRAVLLFVIPILVAATLLKRSAVYATTALCVAAYTLACVSYFVLNFNEGYRVELYGEIGFYSVALFLCSALVATLLPKNR